MKKYIRSSIEQSNNIKASSTEGYVYTYCDECGKKNRVKVTFNNFNEPFNDTEYKCKYCGTNNLLTDPHSYDENGNVVEASQSSSSVEARSYGGAYDVDPEQYFTREDLVEFADDVISCIANSQDILFDVSELYIEGNNITLGLTNTNNGGGFERTITFTVDMRKIRKPWDLQTKYSQKIANMFIDEYNKAIAEDEIYSSTTSSRRYWYFTRHGVQPGSVPKYVNILDIVDTPEGSYFLADGVISTDDLRNYEIKERRPKSAVVEASKSPNSAANKYPKYMKVSRGGQNFSVHYNLIDNSPSADAHQMWLEFQASVSAIKPYDDAEYAWAQIENGHINVIKGGKVIQQYYYFDADDMDVENTEWCDIIIDEAIDLIAKINKDIEPRMVYNSTSIETSADTKLESYRRRVYSKIYHFMTDRLGFDLTEVADYATVDCTESKDGRIKIEVRAELDYDDMWELKTTIDPVVENIDKNAYFDFECPGVLVAYVSSKPANSRYVHAADEPEHKTEPDDEYEPEEVDEDVTVEFDMDRVRIDVDKSGSWEYMDDSFLDAVMTDDDTLYSEEYDVKVRDRNGLLEDLDDILKYDIPVEAGEYRISCHITLVYHITGIEKYDEYPGDNYGDSSEYSTENAEVKFDFHDSYVEDFRIVD